MKNCGILAVCLILAISCIALAQSTSSLGSSTNRGGTVIAPPARSYSGWGWGRRSPGTVGSSYLYGMGDVVRAQGEYNLNTSAAAVNLSEARRREIQNRKSYVDAYFYTRRVNQMVRQAKYEKEKERTLAWLRHHRSMKPKRLTATELDPVTGRLYWPVVLRSQNFKNQCEELQKIFFDRSNYSALSYESYQKVTDLTREMLANLRENIRDYAANDYIAAKQFLEKMAYEAGLPVT